MSDQRPDVVDPDALRAVLRRQAATVTVVTTGRRGAEGAADLPPTGFTATSFTSVSLRPPLVSFCVDRGSSSWPVVRRAEHLAVHLLADDQAPVARLFATRGADRPERARDGANGAHPLQRRPRRGERRNRRRAPAFATASPPVAL